MQAITSLLMSRLIILLNNRGRRESKRELNAEPEDLKKVGKEEREENLAKTVRKDLIAETDNRVVIEEQKEDVGETTDNDI